MRDLVTTLLELVGLVLVAVGAGLFVGQWTEPGGWLTAGAVLIGSSALIEARAKSTVPEQERIDL